MFDRKASKFPNTKTVTFNNKTGNMTLLLKYGEGAEVLPGLPNDIAQY